MAVSKDVEFVGDVKISVVRVQGGYAVSRSDVDDRVFLNPKDGKPYATHTDAISGVQDMAYRMLYEDVLRYGSTQTFFSSTKEERDRCFGKCQSSKLFDSIMELGKLSKELETNHV